jgi:CheY-like chemotaxis protein
MSRMDANETLRGGLMAVLVAAAFTLDATTYLGVSVWVVYFVPLVLSLFTSRPILPLALGVLCALLLALGYFLSPIPPLEEFILLSRVNRVLAAAALIAFGLVGRQFVASRQRLLRQEWIDAGRNGLAARMQGEQRLEQLARHVLSFLSEYLSAPVGSLYVERGGVLVREGSHGLDRPGEGGAGDVVALGQALIGQAAQNGRIVSVRDVPDGYADVRSGVGGAKPRMLVLVPVRADGAVHGVVELGLFTPPEQASLELLGVVSEPIAVALRSAKYRQRQAELLEETQRQAEELKAQQDSLKGANDELERQSRMLEQSQVQLEETNAQLEEQARTLVAEKERLAATQDVLREKAAEVERASRYKSEFLANMSHELRTPLNSALILAKLLVDNKQGNLTPEQVQYATNIYDAGNDLLALINDILDLSKVEAGKLELAFEAVDLTRSFDGLKQRFEPLARQRNIAFTTAIEPGCPAQVETDGLRLQQILANLLSNAFKFTERGSVELRATAGLHGDVLISVRDTGVGIPADQHQVIFEAFRQADGTTNRKYGGTGLGLSISRELSELLGGEIRLESAPGRGSTFTVVLPRRARKVVSERGRAVMPAAAPVVPRGSGPALRPTALEDDRARLNGGGRSVLVVEDDLVFAGILRDLARELGFYCLIAGSAKEGLELARAHQPFAIVLDVGLPDQSGLTVLELLKRDPRARHIPVHVVSVHDYQRVALEMGAVGYALKPVKRDELVATFARLESQTARKTRSVLIVEDDAVQREAIAALLSVEGVTLALAASAEEALEKLAQDTFDCVVLDLMLPSSSGFDVLERMAQDKAPAPPVVVYTARALTADEERRLRRHASSIIIKGARSPERLLEEVTLFLHQVETDLPDDKRELLRAALDREQVLSGRRILIVEDDVRSIFALSSALEPKGAAIEIARNGREALERLGADPAVDLVLMDIMMPEMDGLAATRALRKQPRGADLPVIALTAKAMPDDRQRCLDAGANDYIAKPIDVEKLVSLVRVWMPR